MGVEDFKGVENTETSNKNNDNNHVFIVENQESKIDRQYAERIDSTFGELDESGQKFESGDIIEFMCMTKEGEKVDCSFDIDNQKLIYNNIDINIHMPNGAKITEISFGKGKINIKGKLGIFSGSGNAEYRDLLKAIDSVLEDGQSSIVTKKGKIGLSRT